MILVVVVVAVVVVVVVLAYLEDGSDLGNNGNTKDDLIKSC